MDPARRNYRTIFAEMLEHKQVGREAVSVRARALERPLLPCR